MWTYEQSTGRMTNAAGELLATGYSGNGPSMNRPERQDIPMHGPIPQGTYAISPAFTDAGKGPVVMRLEPDASNVMFGRAGFLIHGDNAAANHTASEGCIILPRFARERIAESQDRILHVVA